MPCPAAAVAGAATRYHRDMTSRPLPVLLLAAALAGCSSAPPVIPRTTVTADPPDARCRAVGADGRLELQAVPLELETLAIGLPVTVSCERDGFHPAVETLQPLPGASLVSRVAGGARLSPMSADAPPPGVDAGSPVPASLLVRLRPLLFTSPGARDRYYERLRAERDARWMGFLERIDGECAARAGASPLVAGPTPAACKAARDSVVRQRADDLRQLELDRRRATFQ